MYFSILPKGEDPDDFIKKNGKEKFIDFLKSKKIIQSYIWDSYLLEVNTNNPFEISKFEKKIKSRLRSFWEIPKNKIIKVIEHFLLPWLLSMVVLVVTATIVTTRHIRFINVSTFTASLAIIIANLKTRTKQVCNSTLCF